MDKKMQLVLDILQLAVEISENTEADVFIDYSGHVDLLSIRIYVGGWEKDKEHYLRNVYLGVAKYRTEEDIIETLDEIYAELVDIS